MFFLEITMKLSIPGTSTLKREVSILPKSEQKKHLAEAISNIPVPNQLFGKIHVMLYLQTLSVDDSLDAQLDSNDQEKKVRFYCC